MAELHRTLSFERIRMSSKPDVRRDKEGKINLCTIVQQLKRRTELCGQRWIFNLKFVVDKNGKSY